MTQIQVTNSLSEFLDEMQKKSVDSANQRTAFFRYLDMRARQKGIPAHGTFELTPLCNLNCKMCYVHLNKQQMGESRLLSADAWNGLIDQAIDAGMMDATLTGGECLTYPGFDEVYLHLWSKGIRTSVLTNGILLTGERVKFLKDHPPRGVQITLYGKDDEEYAAVTGSRQFGTVIRAIESLRDAGLSISIAITPNRYLQDGGESLIRYVHSLGIPYTVNTMLFKPRVETGKNGNDDISLDTYIHLQMVLRKLQGGKILPQKECDLPAPAESGCPQQGLLCSAGRSGFFIDWRGTMHPCASLTDVGFDVLKTGFAASWKEIRKAVDQYPIPAECPNCRYRNLCPICVAAHQQAAPVGHASPVLCARAKKTVEMGLGETIAEKD